jgi:hypothetical protein
MSPKNTDHIPLIEATIENIKRLMEEDADCPELVAKYQDELKYFESYLEPFHS